MRTALLLCTALLGATDTAPARPPRARELTLHTDQVLNQVDPRIYGHFLEHIYHSCDGGLYGDLVWNRSFEEHSSGHWAVEDGELVQSDRDTTRLEFGQPEWGDYEFSLEAQKTSGLEGFLILFRVKGEDEFYWLNLGGWVNTRHTLERQVRGEERWHPVGPELEGSIETGHWYRIRIRCEGTRFRVWLDDNLLQDFTDDAQAHLNGAVGVGTWVTQARFRNLRVVSLDGGVLYEGTPAPYAAPAAAKHWQSLRDGQVFITGENPLNSRFCQLLVPGTAETGLEQRPFRFRADEAYRGSVWARGEGRLTVGLLDSNDQTLDRVDLGAVTDDWREYAFVLRPGQDTSDGVLRVGANGGRVWIDQVSLMPDTWQRSGGFRPDLLEAVACLEPPVIRWPGGCFASAYRWNQGIGPQHRRTAHPVSIWDQQDVYSFGTDEFIAFCRRVGAEPLIVVNIGTPTWVGEGRSAEFEQELLDWLEYCNGPEDSAWGRVRAANGHPRPYNVRFWEIDNETWHMSAAEYADRVRRVAGLMREQDPTIEVAACGSGGFNLDWNREIIERAADTIDYLSIHHYHLPEDFAAGPGAFERFFRETAELIAASANPDLKLYVSEWNAQSTDWRTGLYCGGLLNGFERCGDIVGMAGPALFLRHVSATEWDNAFINFDHRTWFPAPNYVVMKLWREHYAPSRIAVSGDTEGLDLSATMTADGTDVVVKAVNPTEAAVPLAIRLGTPNSTVDEATLQIIAPGRTDARNTLEAPQSVRPEPGEVSVDGNRVDLTLPPLSAAVLSITRNRGSAATALQ